MARRKTMHELVPFLAVHAAKYAEDFKLGGLHPTHYDLMEKYGCRMDGFKRADINFTGGHLKDCGYHLDQYEHECDCELVRPATSTPS